MVPKCICTRRVNSKIIYNTKKLNNHFVLASKMLVCVMCPEILDIQTFLEVTAKKKKKWL